VLSRRQPTAPPEKRRFSTDRDTLSRQVEVTFYRAGGPGGQHRNKTETGVRLLHRPSGLTAAASEERSQRLNRTIALERLRQKLLAYNTIPKRRVPTRMTAAGRQKRIEAKKLQSRKKTLRRGVEE
jgi:ribosome-associated protein